MTAILIGYGRFGQLFYKHFHKDLSIKVVDIKKVLPDELVVSSPEMYNKFDLIILSVPISAIEETCKSFNRFLSKEVAIADVCSVKEYPLGILSKYFPENEIIGTHPLFGPESAADSVVGKHCVMVPPAERGNVYLRLKELFLRKEMVVTEMQAEEHDRRMAWTLCLTQFIGRGLGNLPLPKTGAGTKGYFDLLDIVTRANADTRQLFDDMMKYNRFSNQMRNRVIDAFCELNDSLNGKL